MVRTILALLVILVLVGIALIWTGFIDVRTEGRLKAPDIDVSATGGEVPKIDVDAKEVVIGTRNETVDVPVVTTEERNVAVPVVDAERE